MIYKRENLRMVSEVLVELVQNQESLSDLLTHAHREQGRLLGRMEALGFDLRSEAYLRTLTKDVVKSSEIEGEKLDSDQVRSSIARRLGMDIGGRSTSYSLITT